MSKTAIILGATGLTGGTLLQKLLQDDRYSNIKVFSRSSVELKHPKLEEHLVDVLELSIYREDFTADEVFCCIGTTKRKTPDKTLYHAIDYGIPVNAAALCKTNNIPSFIVISALGANPNSAIFYNRTKGEMEASILTHNIPKTHILQPSLISGNRTEKRSGEYFFVQFMKILNPLLVGALKKYRSIDPETIAAAMVWLANHDFSDKRITSDQIQKIGKSILRSNN